MKKIFFLFSYFLLYAYGNVNAQVQWASKLIDFSSEYKDELIRENSTRWSATQVLGFPNTMRYGQSQLAWTPSKPDNGKEFVTVGFTTPQMVQQIIVGENCNAGSISEIILYDNNGKKYEVYENKNFIPTPKTDNDILTYIKIKPTYNVVKLKLILNTNAIGGGQEIDCIGISTSTAVYKQTVNVIKYSEAVGLPENLGPNINSPLFDHLPLISPDGSMLYFTRKLSDENNKNFNDDIYVSSVMPTGKFSKSENIGPPLNTSEHNFVCYVSSDNNRLYVANKYIRNTYNFAGLSLSTKQKNGEWSKPKPLNIPDLSNKNEFAHYHMSIDENVVLMAIQKNDSYGDLDLYISQKYTDGSWSSPKNLGATINTVGAEGSVFLAADGRTIYFSSTGHPGFGNYDMYMSKRLDNTWTNWSKPLNLGNKINTDEMDIYYTIPAAGDYAYFSSGKSMFGLNDLYRIKLPKEIRPEFVDVKKVLASGNIKKDVQPAVVVNAQLTPIKQETKPLTNSNTQTDEFQKKLDDLKKQQNNPLTQQAPIVTQAPVPVKSETRTLNNNAPDIVYKSAAASPNLKTEDEILAERKALNDLKKQQAIIPSVTEEDLRKIAEKEKQTPKPLTKEQTDAQQQIKNNPTISPENDGLNQLANKQIAEPVSLNKTIPVSAPSTNINIVTNEVDPNSLVNQTESKITTSVNSPLKTSNQQTDELQQKLDDLKKQQANSKIATSSSILNTNKPYDPNENKINYPNPTAPVPVNNATSDELQRKLDALKEQQRQVGQSNKLEGNPWQAKPYDAQPVKEKQEDKATMEYDDYQKKLDALKAQQKNVQTPEITEPVKKVLAVQDIPKSDNSEIVKNKTPENAVVNTPATAISNPVIKKYEEKLKKLQEEMALMNVPANGKDTKLNTVAYVPETTEIQKQTIVVGEKDKEIIIVTESPVKPAAEIFPAPEKSNIEENSNTPLVNNPTLNLVTENAILDSIKEAQKTAAENLDKLGSSKQDLEKDITDLKDQQTKFYQEKDKLAAQNTQLAGEKEKLEAEKKKMDDLLAQMQQERDKLAAEKLKMEQDKSKLEALKKQQEKEVLKLNRAIDSLGKIKQTASNNAELQKKYDLFNVPIEVGAVAIAERIFFVADAAFLQIPSYPEMDKVVDFLKKNNKLKIEIGGHTNGLCDDAFCNKLSNDRAKTCVDYLIKKGVDKNRLSYKGYGKQFLIAAPGSPLNQRVEIKILSVN